MSIGLVLPSALHELGIKIGADFRQSNKFHVSTSYKNAKSMITHMDRPRQVITMLPTSANNSEKTLETIIEYMGPLDIILDCMIYGSDRIEERSELCFHNSTQYMALDITREGIYVAGTYMAYLENKNLLRKINKNVKYVGGIEEV